MAGRATYSLSLALVAGFESKHFIIHQSFSDQSIDWTQVYSTRQRGELNALSPLHAPLVWILPSFSETADLVIIFTSYNAEKWLPNEQESSKVEEF